MSKALHRDIEAAIAKDAVPKPLPPYHSGPSFQTSMYHPAPEFESVAATETSKYRRMWTKEEYTDHSPGKVWASRLPKIIGGFYPDGEGPAPIPGSPRLSHAGLFPKGSTVIDLGCGAGEAAPELVAIGLDVAQVDLADFRTKDEYRGLDLRRGPDALIEPFPFRVGPLWGDWNFKGTRHARADLGFCCDVMEHIPSEYVMLVLDRIRQNTQACFFSIAHIPDRWGSLIGMTLHLTLRPFEWWRDRIGEQMGEVVIGRDLMGESIYYVKCR